MSGTSTSGTGRSRYHHGDLRAALLEAGLDLTRADGPGALSLREATRRAGVSPNAAYRHFTDRQALLDAVAEAVRERMASRMVVRRGPDDRSPADRALARLRSVGLGYIRFALAEPGWFAVAFFGEATPSRPADRGTPPPFVRLAEALDELVTADVLAPGRRAGAEWPCFAAVHGFAELALHGPLRNLSRAAVDRLAVRTVDDIVAGVIGASD